MDIFITKSVREKRVQVYIWKDLPAVSISYRNPHILSKEERLENNPIPGFKRGGGKAKNVRQRPVRRST
jgi:hypothetical protein